MSAAFWLLFSALCVVAAYRLLLWSSTFPLSKPEEEQPPQLSAESVPVHRRRRPQRDSSFTRAA